MSEHFIGRVTQKAILKKDNKILICMDGNGLWQLPGGSLDIGETPQQGLQREIMEEIGIDVFVGRVVYLETFKQMSDGSDRLLIIYEASLKDDNVEIKIDNEEVLEIAWVDKDSFMKYPLFDNIERALKDYFSMI